MFSAVNLICFSVERGGFERTAVNWLDQVRLPNAAKRYARRLPEHLTRGWGASTFYTTGQIEAAIRASRLDRRFSVIGFAMFLPEDEFVALAGKLPIRLSYEAARDLFFRYQPYLPSPSDFSDAPPKTPGIEGAVRLIM